MEPHWARGRRWRPIPRVRGWTWGWELSTWERGTGQASRVPQRGEEGWSRTRSQTQTWRLRIWATAARRTRTSTSSASERMPAWWAGRSSRWTERREACCRPSPLSLRQCPLILSRAWCQSILTPHPSPRRSPPPCLCTKDTGRQRLLKWSTAKTFSDQSMLDNSLLLSCYFSNRHCKKKNFFFTIISRSVFHLSNKDFLHFLSAYLIGID